MVVPSHGKGALLPGGKIGNKGGGRTPDEFKAKMRELAGSTKALDYFEQCLLGEHGPKAHASAMAFAAERGYGKVKETIEHTGEGGGPIAMTVRFVK